MQHQRISIWLYDNTEFRIDAYIIVRLLQLRGKLRILADVQGFDEFMNVVLDEAEEVYDCSAKPGKEVKPRRSLGELALGGRRIEAPCNWIAGSSRPSTTGADT